MAHDTPHPVLSNFPNFYESWLDAQQSFLQQLLNSAAKSQDTQDKNHSQLRLINQVLSHFHQYYDHLSKAAAEDVFQVLSTPWLTPFERTLVWISGFKPSLIFRLLAAAGVHDDLTPSQAAEIQRLRADVKRNERELTGAMASLQETVAAPPILGLARRGGRLVDGEICEMESAIEELKMGMLGVFYRADFVRGSTVMKVVEILNSDQMVRVLAAAVEFQLRIRRWGLQRDLGRTGGTAT